MSSYTIGTCSECKFWEEIIGPKEKSGETEEGYCRRYAPRPRVAFVPLPEQHDRGIARPFMPQTFFDDWCGEWEHNGKGQ